MHLLVRITAVLLTLGLLSAMPARAGESDAMGVFEAYAGFLNDASARRRLVVYTPHAVSAKNGVQHSYVHVGDGSAAFGRTDMVVSAPMPIVMRRVYHSARLSSRTFGETGWRLAPSERIHESDSGLLYEYGNGTTVQFTEAGGFVAPIDAYLTDIVKVDRNDDTIVIEWRNGVLKTFSRVASDLFLLSLAADHFGNYLDYEYDDQHRVERIHTNTGAAVDLTWGDGGSIVRLEDSLGRSVEYLYNDAGELDGLIDMRGEQWRYSYSASRLATATAPNGRQRLRFDYADDGRVGTVHVHGAPTSFDYSGNVTTVTNDRDQDIRFVQGFGGLTTKVTNPLGLTTEIELDRSGLPERLIRDQQALVSFHYHRTRPGHVDRATVSGERDYTVGFDANGRIAYASARGVAGSYRVRGYWSGTTPKAVVFTGGSEAVVELDASGQLSGLVNENGQSMTFNREGNEWLAAADGLSSAMLEFDAADRVKRIAAEGNWVDFEYDNAGLREFSFASNGTSSTYHYDAAGTMFLSEVTYGQRLSESYAYVFGPHNRVDRIIEGDGVEHVCAYGADGQLQAFESPVLTGSLALAYDDLGRLKSITHPKHKPAVYKYADGEGDIVAQLDKRAVPFNQHRERTEFASWFDVRLGRVTPAAVGLVDYDDRLMELKIPWDPLDWNPSRYAAAVVSALNLWELASLPTMARIWTAILPSNRLFVPPELWAVNCCFCIPYQLP